jgi:hypothetical protein
MHDTQYLGNEGEVQTNDLLCHVFEVHHRLVAGPEHHLINHPLAY